MFAPGAGRIIGPAAGLAILLGLLAALEGQFLLRVLLIVGAGAALAVTLFLAWFFRDPERTPGPGIVSAADGRVVKVTADGDRWQVAVFMNITDVHVNRLPLTAQVDRVHEAGSGFRAAYRPDAEHNLQRRYALSSAIGPVEVVQMTGVVARRLVTFVRAGESYAKGARLGMIVLGSRVDVFLPRERTRVVVAEGARVRAGETTIAEELP